MVDVRENQRDKKEWIIQRNWQYWAHMTLQDRRQIKKNNNAQHYTENKIYEQHEPYHKPGLNPCVSNEKTCTKYYFWHQYVIVTLK